MRTTYETAHFNSLLSSCQTRISNSLVCLSDTLHEFIFRRIESKMHVANIYELMQTHENVHGIPTAEKTHKT